MRLVNLFQNLGLSLLLYSSVARAEYYDQPLQVSFNKNDGIVAGLEVLIGCAIAGIPHAPNLSKMGRQCAKGALAGMIIYTGEKAASYASTPGMGWAAQILVNSGASMRENAAQGKRMFEEIGYTIGPLHLRLGNESQWYLHPGFFVGVGYGVARGSFNPTATLLSGTAVFELQEGRIAENTYSAAIGNVVLFDKMPNGQVVEPEALQRTYGHEQVHATQYRSFGTLELVLRQIDSYRTFTERTHFVLGAGAGSMGLFLLSYPLDHDDRPIEFVSGRLATPSYEKEK